LLVKRNTMNELKFLDDQHIFSIRIKQLFVEDILNRCDKSLPNETGGILVGSYIDNYSCANISKVLKAPPDSRSGPTWFHRGTKGVKLQLDRLWKEKKQYYIGEWHFHPNNSSNLSFQDIRQMKAISINKKYNCPEPILLIVGGNTKHWEFSTYVFPRGRKYINLKRINCC
jgi:integrative and conjugative element protein (TIGR02256 family)